MESWNCPLSAAAGSEKLSDAQHHSNSAAVLYLRLHRRGNERVDISE